MITQSDVQALRQVVREVVEDALGELRYDNAHPAPAELRHAPSFADQLGEILMALPSGMRITIEQGPASEEVGE